MSAHVQDVLVLVADFLDRERDDLEPHLAHVVGDVGTHPVGDHLRFLDDLLDRQLADDAAEVPFHHQPDQPFAVRLVLVEELLGRGQDADRVRLDLDLGDRFDVDRHALAGVEVLLRRDIEAHQFERELTAVLEHRPDDLAAPLDDLRPAEPVDDQRLVRPHLAEQGRYHADDEQQHEREPDDDRDQPRRIHRKPLSATTTRT